jgi:hypothetical protein
MRILERRATYTDETTSTDDDGGEPTKHHHQVEYGRRPVGYFYTYSDSDDDADNHHRNSVHHYHVHGQFQYVCMRSYMTSPTTPETHFVTICRYEDDSDQYTDETHGSASHHHESKHDYSNNRGSDDLSFTSLESDDAVDDEGAEVKHRTYLHVTRCSSTFHQYH